MGTVAVSIQGVASVFTGTDNPIALVDWFSSFLRTLEKFNGVVDKIVTVSIILCPAIQPMIFRLSSNCLDSPLRASSVDYSLLLFKVWPLRFTGYTI